MSRPDMVAPSAPNPSSNPPPALTSSATGTPAAPTLEPGAPGNRPATADWWSWLVFLGLPLAIGLVIGLNAIGRWQERAELQRQRERTDIIDRLVSDRCIGFEIGERFRWLVQELRVGWALITDIEGAQLVNQPRFPGRLRIFHWRQGRWLFRPNRDVIDRLIAETVPALFLPDGPLASRAAQLDPPLRACFGPGVTLRSLRRRNSQFFVAGPATAPAVLFFEVLANGVGNAIVIDRVAPDQADGVRQAMAEAERHHERLGNAVPDLDLWSPPPGVASGAMAAAWARAERENRSQIVVGDSSWHFLRDRWGGLLAWHEPVREPASTSGARLLLLGFSALAAWWGVRLVRQARGEAAAGFIPIGRQLRFLFIYVTLLPLSSALLIAWFGLQDQEDRLRHAIFTESLQQIAQVEGGFDEYRMQHLAQCRELRDRIARSADDPAEIRNAMEQYLRPAIFDQVHVADVDGNALVTTIRPHRRSVLQVFRALGRFAVRQFAPHRVPANRQQQVSTLDLMADEAVTSEELGWSSVMQFPDRLHELTMGRTPLDLYWDVYPDLASGPAVVIIQQNRSAVLGEYYRRLLQGRSGQIRMVAINTHRLYAIPTGDRLDRIELLRLAMVSDASGQVLEREITLSQGQMWAVVMPDPGNKRILLAAAFDPRELLRQLAPIRFAMLIGLLGSLLVAAIAGRILTGFFLAPIGDLTAGIEAIRLRRSEVRVRVRRADEFGELAAMFNLLLGEFKELELARVVQHDLLPAAPPSIAGYSLAAINVTATDLGGDYYDFVPLPDGSQLLVIGDVTGHGVAAALAMAMAKAAIAFELARGQPDLARLLEAVNQVFFRELKPQRKYMTLMLGRFDPSRHEIEFRNAGHNYPLVITGHGTGSAFLEMPGVPMGLRRKAMHQGNRVTLSPGDALILYSDGYPECPVQGTIDDPIGNDLFAAIGRECVAGHATATATMDAMLAELDRRRIPGPLPDDVTLVVIRRDRAPG